MTSQPDSERNERRMVSSVGTEYNGSRLDLYLSKRFSYLSRTAWQREIHAGRIELNGEVNFNVKKSVYTGDIIRYLAEDISEPEIDADYTVIYEDENFLAVNKTGNLPVHPSGIFFHNTLVTLLEQKSGMKFYPVHRLDRETSGVILLGKSSLAASEMQKNFSTVRKEYIAITRGEIIEKKFRVEVPIGPARNSRINKKREAYPGAEEYALTGFETLSCANGHSVIKALLVTGRLHQIRVHLKYYGYPVIGDKMYGDDESIFLDYVQQGESEELIRRAGFARCALHSRSLCYTDPFSGINVEITAPLFPDMELFIAKTGLRY